MVEKFSSRFAVKEAVMKALKIRGGNGVAFTDIEESLNPLDHYRLNNIESYRKYKWKQY